MSIRRTVALLIPEINNEYFDGIVRGARMAASEKKINLLIIVGGVYGADHSDNVLYRLADKRSIDAVILATTSIIADSKDYEPFLQETKSKPQLILSDKHEGIPGIYYDSTTGIREAMDYLTSVKGCKRILMFAGPEFAGDSEERLEEYRKCMMEAKLHLSPSMIVHGDHTEGCLEEARKLIESNPGAEAVICSNDRQAQALYRVLRENDLKIGKDIFVVGFDDITESAYMDPPLASVSASHISLGYEACTLAARMGDGENAEDKILKCHFINRESAGYNPYFQLYNFEHRRNVKTGTVFDIPTLTSSMVDFIFTGDVQDYQASCQRKLLEDFFSRLLDTYLGAVVRRRSMSTSDYSVDNIFDLGILDNIDCDRLFRVLDSIYRVYCAKELSETSRMELSNLIARVKSSVAESLERRSGNIRKVVDSIHTSISRFSKQLIEIDPGKEDCFGRLLEAMPLIGVINASIFLYKEPVRHEPGEEFVMPDKMYLKAYRDRSGVHIVDEAHQETDTDDVMDHRYLEGGMSHSFFAVALHYGSYQRGIMLIDYDDEYNGSFDLINNHINLAVSHFDS